MGNAIEALRYPIKQELLARFLGYEKLREIDESSKNAKVFDTNTVLAAGEIVPPI